MCQIPISTVLTLSTFRPALGTLARRAPRARVDLASPLVRPVRALGQGSRLKLERYRFVDVTQSIYYAARICYYLVWDTEPAQSLGWAGGWNVNGKRGGGVTRL